MLDIDDTQNVPGPVKVAILTLAQQGAVTKVLHAPLTVAAILVAPLTLEVESIVLIQPCVESTNIKVTDCPSVFKVAFSLTEPILSVPFGTTVKAFVCQVPA